MLRTAASRCSSCSCSSILSRSSSKISHASVQISYQGQATPPRLRSLHSTSIARITSTSRNNDDNDNAGAASFGDRPAPPRLPAHLQKEFEELQRKAATPLAGASKTVAGATADVNASVKREEDLHHPDLRRKPTAEFEGDINPKTGEVGGPKNNPLSYEKEWTYGGRATDF